MKRKFKVTLEQEIEVIIYDEKIDAAFMKSFRKVFYNFHSLKEHAEHIAFNHDDDYFEYFMEGYGDVKSEHRDESNVYVSPYFELKADDRVISNVEEVTTDD